MHYSSIIAASRPSEEDQGELLFAKAVFFSNFSFAGSVIAALQQHYSCNKGGEKEEDQGELLFAKAVFFDNFSCVGNIIGAL